LLKIVLLQGKCGTFLLFFKVEDAVWIAEKAVERAKSDWRGSLTLLKELDIKPQLLNFKSWLWACQTVSCFNIIIPLHFCDNAGVLTVYAIQLLSIVKAYCMSIL
jgi:hypothetical protein